MANGGDGGRNTIGVPSFVPVDENRPGKFTCQTDYQQCPAIYETVDLGPGISHRILPDHTTAETVYSRETEPVQVNFGIQLD